MFRYDEDAPETPISLSLPREGSATRRAAASFLENLLPDHEHTRVRLAAAYGARSTETVELLQKAGGDIAGGLVLLPADTEPKTIAAEMNPALDRDIADRIRSIKHDPDAWAPGDLPARFSLAGTQGKFAIAAIDGDWYWSNAAVPSTHIVKPGRPDLRGVEDAELAALNLARAVGVSAPSASILRVADQHAFAVERFDRAAQTGPLPRRLHAEDLAQARGIGPDNKYGVTARQVIDTLRPVDASGTLVTSFLTQLAFNTLVGNADAHAKNYSILLGQNGITFAPIYDVVPVGLYPAYDQKLAMRIAGARMAAEVTIAHWRKLARTSGLNEDAVAHLVIDMARNVLEHNDSAWNALDFDQRTIVRTAVARNAERLQ
ncbi:type II toxin-antitoxin system HipA family toxin [Gordonia amarae]|uniref:Type II toxin-antitoxin system HipA family toxin n=1 Tax=Gordonia amarae TaxID=36821 RepID=A0A857KJ08_9ACTN|nr:serine/threonine-protein kinase HipA [Gordonia amarae]QHN17408.1 type II toxin-antitoxin system HipA family toxin [Gordonia amarae]QHN21934.1 type II toxin-antitoxin system HipA family toxin [Gordonia amarae]QHN30814.1 type II toxin-antitoxin system HipA family toxin [Gordonia amarae]QHN39560.1 type II toxin-antitoxin system HipA family toxin [Gordonia amarae]